MRQRTVVPGRTVSRTGRVALEGGVVHVADIRATGLRGARDCGVRATHQLGVPLLRDSEPIGVIMLTRHAGRAVHRAADRTGRAPSPTRRSSRSRMRGCSANCRPARATSKNRSNTRPRPATCSTSSAARPPMCNRCWTQWSKRPPGFAAPMPERSRYARARSTAWRRVRSAQRTPSIGRGVRQRTSCPRSRQRRRAGGARRQGRACRGHPR